MAIDQKGLELVLGELAELTERPHLTKGEQRKHSYLLSVAAAIRSGATLSEISQRRLNETEDRAGMTRTNFANVEKRKHAEVWQRFIATGKIEQRDQTIGNGQPEYLQGSQGSFVPRSFFAGVKASMKRYDALLDPNVVTYVETENGRPMQFGMMSDTETSAATIVTENSNQAGNETDIASVSEADLYAWSFRTPLWRLSIEAYQDLDQLTTAIDLFQSFSASRVARGVGNYLMNGTGVNQPLGLLTSLQTINSDAQGAIAIGSAESTGGSQTGANSIGWSDTVALMESVDDVYWSSPKCGFMMNQSTRSFLSRIISKQGLPLMKFEDGVWSMHGFPCWISPSLPSIGSKATPLLFGDYSYWVTRHATAGDRVEVLHQAAGLVERGECGLRSWSRFDGAFLYSSTNGSCPVKFLVNHT